MTRILIIAICISPMLSAHADVACNFNVSSGDTKLREGMVDAEPIQVNLGGVRWKKCTISSMNLTVTTLGGMKVPSKLIGVNAVCSDDRGVSAGINSKVNISSPVQNVESSFMQLIDEAVSYDGKTNTLKVSPSSKEFRVFLLCGGDSVR